MGITPNSASYSEPTLVLRLLYIQLRLYIEIELVYTFTGMLCYILSSHGLLDSYNTLAYGLLAV